jgi:hypothetical protein
MPFVSLSEKIIDKSLFARDNLYSYTLHRALENENNVKRFGSCGTPAKQIVYPDNGNSKSFIPRGTILFRCNDKVGCCPHNTDECQPIKQETIKVAFIVHSLKRARIRSFPELIEMQNHTKCGCRPKGGTHSNHNIYSYDYQIYNHID